MNEDARLKHVLSYSINVTPEAAELTCAEDVRAVAPGAWVESEMTAPAQGHWLGSGLGWRSAGCVHVWEWGREGYVYVFMCTHISEHDPFTLLKCVTFIVCVSCFSTVHQENMKHQGVNLG